MSLVVKKFGGSSLADLSCMRLVADIISRAYQSGQSLVIVVSASAGHTDRLVESARAISALPDPREYDALLSSAEQTSAALLSLLLIQQSIPAVSLTGIQAGIRTNQVHNKAHIESVDASRIQSHLKAGQVVVITGFQGQNTLGDITTLGRGGSDMTAVVLAGVLQAEACYIYTDVNGVYSVDPRLVTKATRLSQISLKHMCMMAKLGAKVMQQQALDYCYQHHIPLRIASTFEPDEGTLIVNTQQGSDSTLGIACQSNQVQLTLSGLIDWSILIEVLRNAMKRSAIDIDLVIQSHMKDAHSSDLNFTVDESDAQQAYEIVSQLKGEFNLQNVKTQSGLAKVSMVGDDLMSRPSVATEVFSLACDQGILVRWFVSSDARMTWIVQQDRMKDMACLLHRSYVDKAPVIA
ncbi:MAG: aspartate kinase [Coxiellaceae bacterium]|mgnify:CR=1 FL=1|nr:aspartate kinase [Coxiellaceae bacterium]|tara:strand:+ start:1965 stop:3188 length:1224 start_codon:yes stop_codon:yes gene_type:complete